MPSTSAGISPSHDSHQTVKELPQKQAFDRIISRLARLFSADMLSSNVLSSMRDVQCQIQAQLEQHGETA